MSLRAAPPRAAAPADNDRLHRVLAVGRALAEVSTPVLQAEFPISTLTREQEKVIDKALSILYSIKWARNTTDTVTEAEKYMVLLDELKNNNRSEALALATSLQTAYSSGSNQVRGKILKFSSGKDEVQPLLWFHKWVAAQPEARN